MKNLRFCLVAPIIAVLLVNACTGDDPTLTTVGGDDDSGVTTDTGGGGPGADGATTDGASGEGGGGCGDTTMSKDNCGACGHSCGGGDCMASLCQPVKVADNVDSPVGVAVAGGSVFWLRTAAVERCPTTGCTGTPTLISDQVALTASEPKGSVIVTDGAKVAWLAPGSNAEHNGLEIDACDVTGCVNGFAPTHSTGFNGTPVNIALSGSIVFAPQASGGARFGPLATLVMAGGGEGGDIPSGVAVDDQNLYAADTNAQGAAGVDHCTRAPGAACVVGGTSTRLFNVATYLAAASGVVVATSMEGIKVCPATGCGGTGTVVMASDTSSNDIAALGTNAAWTNPDGTVRVCTLPGCTNIRTIATAQSNPMGVTIGADGFVYWANKGTSANGSIWRAAL